MSRVQYSCDQYDYKATIRDSLLATNTIHEDGEFPYDQCNGGLTNVNFLKEFLLFSSGLKSQR